MNDWFDPLGVGRMADALATTAARTLQGRRVDVPSVKLSARVAKVHRAAPSRDIGAVLGGRLGLWRRLDLTFEPVTFDERTIDTVRVEARDIRAIDALPQRVEARELKVRAELGSDAAKEWIAALAPVEADVRIDDGRLLATLPGLGRFGDAVLEPTAEGRTVGVDVRRARLGGREVALPKKLHRRYERELEWLPEGTRVTELVGSGDGVEIAVELDRYVVELDVPRLLADLGSRQTGAAIEVLLGG